jgi:hypothetical protein
MTMRVINIAKLPEAVDAAVRALELVGEVATLGDDSDAGIAIGELADLVEEFRETLRKRLEAVENRVEEELAGGQRGVVP